MSNVLRIWEILAGVGDGWGLAGTRTTYRTIQILRKCDITSVSSDVEHFILGLVFKIKGNARSVEFSEDLGGSGWGWGWLGPRWDQEPGRRNTRGMGQERKGTRWEGDVGGRGQTRSGGDMMGKGQDGRGANRVDDKRARGQTG